MFKHYGIELLLLPKRIAFQDTNGAMNHPWFAVAWFTWQILPKTLIFS
jgi:hypothetical protein